MAHYGVGVDADDGEEYGYPCGPNDGVERDCHEVVRCDAVKAGEVGGVFDVHEHGSELDNQAALR